jgi:hypothetical protein
VRPSLRGSARLYVYNAVFPRRPAALLRSTLGPAARRRILADLGIDVWRLRSRAVEAPSPSEDPVGAVFNRDRPLAESRLKTAPTSAARTSQGNALPQGPESRLEAAPTGAIRFEVVSLSTAGVTLLLGAPPTGRAARLARDLLSAATGRWDAEPAMRTFEWPPGHANRVPAAGLRGAAERALAAFVDKELADHGATLLLLDDSVAARLEAFQRPGDRIAIGELAVIARDPAEKRRIWSAIGRLRAAGGKP